MLVIKDLWFSLPVCFLVYTVGTPKLCCVGTKFCRVQIFMDFVFLSNPQNFTLYIAFTFHEIVFPKIFTTE